MGRKESEAAVLQTDPRRSKSAAATNQLRLAATPRRRKQIEQ
jgi:hypothetical protein